MSVKKQDVRDIVTVMLIIFGMLIQLSFSIMHPLTYIALNAIWGGIVYIMWENKEQV